MSRLTMNMTTQDAIIALSEGNPGALRVSMELLKNGKNIDPEYSTELYGDTFFLCLLDEYEIYGPRIWMLYKDVCKQEISYAFAILRACQLGQIGVEKVNHAIDNYGEGIDLEEVMKAVQERLPKFNKTPL